MSEYSKMLICFLIPRKMETTKITFRPGAGDPKWFTAIDPPHPPWWVAMCFMWEPGGPSRIVLDQWPILSASVYLKWPAETIGGDFWSNGGDFQKLEVTSGCLCRPILRPMKANRVSCPPGMIWERSARTTNSSGKGGWEGPGCDQIGLAWHPLVGHDSPFKKPRHRSNSHCIIQ